MRLLQTSKDQKNFCISNLHSKGPLLLEIWGPGQAYYTSNMSPWGGPRTLVLWAPFSDLGLLIWRYICT